jgi:hypothetical protein
MMGMISENHLLGDFNQLNASSVLRRLPNSKADIIEMAFPPYSFEINQFVIVIFKAFRLLYTFQILCLIRQPIHYDFPDQSK